MGLGKFLEGVARGVGTGALQNYNVQTLGPDFKEKREAHASRMTTEQIVQELQRLGVIEAQDKLGAEERLAGQEFPQIGDPRQAVQAHKAKLAAQEIAEGQARHKSAIDLAGAQAEDYRARPAKYAEEAARIRKATENYESLIEDRKADNERAIGREERLGRPKPAKAEMPPRPPRPLSASEYQKFREAGRIIAGEANDNPTEAQIDVETEKLIAAYEKFRDRGRTTVAENVGTSAQVPTPSPTPAPAAGPETKVFTTGPCAGKTATRTPRGTWTC